MNIFRQLRWKMTLSYTIVTVSALLVMILILGGLFLARIFIPAKLLNPEQMIVGYMKGDVYSMWSQILSQSPVDMQLVSQYIKDPRSEINDTDIFHFGAMHFVVVTEASVYVQIIGRDGILLGSSAEDIPFLNSPIGLPYDPSLIPGFEAPFKAALAGETAPARLYVAPKPNQQYIVAVPVFNRAISAKNEVVGINVIMLDAVPTQENVPFYVLNIAGRSLLFLLLGMGIVGAIFGSIFAHGLDTRFKLLSNTTDLWSGGDFSRYVDDNAGDEISQFAQRLNNMAEQLQSLLRRRQDMAVSEERNRLARDLHDSAKQQALAASLELGTALTLFERDPQGARKHLVEGDTLVDSVRRELTDLVDELRPQSIGGQDLSVTLREHAMEWSHRSGIESNIHIEGNDVLSLEMRETLFRIAQEALANVARHSSASCADVFLEYGTNLITLIIQDNGRGFDTNAQHGGIGLYSMRERAEVLGGSFSVESVPGQGTQINVTFPRAN